MGRGNKKPPLILQSQIIHDENLDDHIREYYNVAMTCINIYPIMEIKRYTLIINVA